MYVFAEHVHNTYISHHVKLVYAKACTCYVRLMYMFDKHVHAYKHTETQYVIMRFLPPCTCLVFNSKKKFTYCLKYAITVGPLCLRCGAVVSPFHLRFKSVSAPFLRIGEKWDLHRICKGGRRDLHKTHVII